MEDISDFTILIKQQLMYVCIIGIFIAIIISIFLSSKITEPITKITKKAKKLGSGDTEVTFEESGIKEIDELSEALTQAQMEMVKTDELRRDLMANVSHDLKTPLTMIKAYAEMIRDISYKDHDKMNEHLGIIVDETDRLTVLVNDLRLSKDFPLYATIRMVVETGFVNKGSRFSKSLSFICCASFKITT